MAGKEIWCGTTSAEMMKKTEKRLTKDERIKKIQLEWIKTNTKYLADLKAEIESQGTSDDNPDHGNEWVEVTIEMLRWCYPQFHGLKMIFSYDPDYNWSINEYLSGFGMRALLSDSGTVVKCYFNTTDDTYRYARIRAKDFPLCLGLKTNCGTIRSIGRSNGEWFYQTLEGDNREKWYEQSDGIKPVFPITWTIPNE